MWVLRLARGGLRTRCFFLFLSCMCKLQPCAGAGAITPVFGFFHFFFFILHEEEAERGAVMIPGFSLSFLFFLSFVLFVRSFRVRSSYYCSSTLLQQSLQSSVSCS
ncbi:hypothetical protein BZA05DRAFT_394656 [Tricharina praecox]|uniref:uncharacterized protein n=1 Tax=Tricharina praecox TaxID=43433 RepID=UPI00221FC2ED|nr:uncharacterized protein BZA05DRAFT_394656 [Tricharina praecox]KAI5853776.1 hypothetical protein BZA05DRAFT_394656 [Tricharina praecox]